jgi:hypothetical protein
MGGCRGRVQEEGWRRIARLGIALGWMERHCYILNQLEYEYRAITSVKGCRVGSGVEWYRLGGLRLSGLLMLSVGLGGTKPCTGCAR